MTGLLIESRPFVKQKEYKKNRSCRFFGIERKKAHFGHL